MSGAIPTETTPTSPTPTTPTPDPAAAVEAVGAPVPDPSAPASLLGDPAPVPFNPETFTLPEGFEKNEQFTQFSEWAKEANLTEPQAKALMDIYAPIVKQQLEQAASATQQAWEKQNVDWQNEVKADKELGGTNLPAVKQTISKLLDNPDLSDPKFREALTMTGGGNHPAIIRTLYRWAQKLGEGASIAGSPPSRNANGQLASRPENLADAFYGPSGPHQGGPRLS